MWVDDGVSVWMCDICGMSWCECCIECGMPHRDCEGCDCPECYVCNVEKEPLK